MTPTPLSVLRELVEAQNAYDAAPLTGIALRIATQNLDAAIARARAMVSAPPEGVGLTDEEILDLARQYSVDFRWPSSAIDIARAIERAVLSKNGMNAGTSGVIHPEPRMAYELGWINAAHWAKRTDLIADIDSPPEEGNFRVKEENWTPTLEALPIALQFLQRPVPGPASEEALKAEHTHGATTHG